MSPSLLLLASAVALTLALGACQRSEPTTVATDSAPATQTATPAAVASTTAAVPGPVAGTRITEAYARMGAREAYFWAWPMINVYNRRQEISKNALAVLLTRWKTTPFEVMCCRSRGKSGKDGIASVWADTALTFSCT